MEKISDYTGKIIGVVIGLLLAGILLPIGLENLLAYNGTDATINTLVSEVLPILAIIGIVMLFIAYKGKH